MVAKLPPEEREARRKAGKRAYYQRNKERIKAKVSAYRRSSPQTRRANILAKYGLTLDEYERMLDRQRGVCAICWGPPNGRWKTFVVDHCHRTGKVRGLLCEWCNLSIGKLYDDAGICQRAADYLRRHES